MILRSYVVIEKGVNVTKQFNRNGGRFVALNALWQAIRGRKPPSRLIAPGGG